MECRKCRLSNSWVCNSQQATRRSAGILPAVPRASRPRRGGRGRLPDARRDDGATIATRCHGQDP